MATLKVIQGGLSTKLKCRLCSKESLTSEIYKNAFVWATLSEDWESGQAQTGFKTSNFNICKPCAQDFLFQLQAYIGQRFK